MSASHYQLSLEGRPCKGKESTPGPGLLPHPLVYEGGNETEALELSKTKKKTLNNRQTKVKESAQDAIKGWKSIFDSTWLKAGMEET